MPWGDSDKKEQAITWGGLKSAPSYAVKPDILYIMAMNSIAKDTSTHAPFYLLGQPINYYFDALSLIFIKGCQ
jgi:hypothetical protein